jgi:hypothetical protein
MTRTLTLRAAFLCLACAVLFPATNPAEAVACIQGEDCYYAAENDCENYGGVGMMCCCYSPFNPSGTQCYWGCADFGPYPVSCDAFDDPPIVDCWY